MKTYKEHYEYCKSLYNLNSSKYKSIYDLRVDNNFLDNIIDETYYKLIKIIRDKIDTKIKNNQGKRVIRTKPARAIND